MADPERNQVVYVTADSSRWMRVDVPFGLITPPTLVVHEPMAGPVEFFYADVHHLRVPAAAVEGDGEYRAAVVEMLSVFDDDPLMSEELFAEDPDQRTAQASALVRMREIGRAVLEGQAPV